MSFGFEEKPAKLPKVETQKITYGVVTEFPKFKYHAKYLKGLVVENAMEEEALGEGWFDSPADCGAPESHPSIDPRDEVQLRLAKIRDAVKSVQG